MAATLRRAGVAAQCNPGPEIRRAEPGRAGQGAFRSLGPFDLRRLGAMIGNADFSWDPMKVRTRWLACTTCTVLRDHIPASSGLTPFGLGRTSETWVCTVCGTAHPMAAANSDQADRERLERLGQLRLID